MPVYRQLIVQYTADYKDAEAGHKKLESSVSAGSKQMAANVDSAAKQMSASMNSAAKNMRNDMDQLSFRAIMVGQALTMGVTAPIIGLGVAATKANMDMDSFTRGLNVVMGSAAASAREMERLKDVARLPGLGLKEAYQGSLNLQAVGLSAKQARDTLMSFGNALGTVGKGKNELAAVQEQVMQIISKGKVMTEDIRIIRNYVPQISAAMREAFGTANAEEIAKMGVSGEEFVNRIVKQLGKLPLMTSGVKNELENVQDAIFQGMAKIGEDIAPMVISAAHAVSDLVGAFNELPKPIRQSVEAGLGIAALVGPAVLVFGQYKQLTMTTALLRTYLQQNVVATTESAAAETSHASAVAVDTVAVEANTAAIARNSAAKGTNITASAAQGVMSFGTGAASGKITRPVNAIQPALFNYATEAKVMADATGKQIAFEAAASKVRTTITAQEIAAAKAAGTMRVLNASVVDTALVNAVAAVRSMTFAGALGTVTAAAKTAGTALIAVGKVALPLLALAAVVDMIAGAFERADKSSDSAADSIDRAADSLKRYQTQLDKKFTTPDLERGQGVAALQDEIRKQQKVYDAAAVEASAHETNQARNEELYRGMRKTGLLAPGARLGKWYTENYGEDYERTDTLVASQKRRDEALSKLQAAKDKLLSAGYDLAGNKLAKSAVENEIANLSKQAFDFEVAAVKASQVGDEAGEAWAKIQGNYYKKLTENAEKAKSDGSFDRVGQDMLAREEFSAAKIKFNINQAIDKQEKAQVEIVTALDASAAVAKMRGDDLAAAKTEALKAYNEAYFKATEVDANTGKLKNSEGVIKNLLDTATAKYWTEYNQAIKDAAEKWKTEAKEAVDNWGGLTTAILEGKKIAAEASGKTFNAMFIGNEQEYVGAYSDAYKASIEGKPAALVSQMFANAKAKRDAEDAKIRKQIEQANRVDLYAGKELAAMRSDSAAKKMQDKLENVTDFESRLNITTKIVDLQETAAVERASKEYNETWDRLNEVAATGVDVTNQMAVALQKQTSAMEDAHDAAKKLIDDELKHQAYAVQQKVMDIRREDEERQKAYLAEIDRRKNLVHFSTAEDQWRGAVIGGVNENLRLAEMIRPINDLNSPTTSREAIFAIQELQRIQQETNLNIIEVKRAVESLTGKSGAFGR
jgi:tape measure domain-containing protein